MRINKKLKTIPKLPVAKSEAYQTNTIICIILSVFFGYMHTNHIEKMFENEKHFSHLSSLERELSFRTESGLYYYYFKNLVIDANSNPLRKSLLNSIDETILRDNRTEYPLTINSLKRFNLYPEIVLAVFYRVMNAWGLLDKNCWNVERDSGMPPVESCVGCLEPIYFYVKSNFKLIKICLIVLSLTSQKYAV